MARCGPYTKARWGRIVGSSVLALTLTTCASPPRAPEARPALPSTVGTAPSTAPARAMPRGAESLEQVRFRLLEEQDTDCDQKITKNDQGSGRFSFRLLEQDYELNGHYVLSNLLQELSLALRHGALPQIERVMEDPLQRTSRLIRDVYWPALTRRADASGLPRLLEDPKRPPSRQRYLYVPSDDPRALDYFRAAGKRYDAAHEQLAAGAVNFPFGDLDDIATSEEKRRVLIAMLRTPEGRQTLAGVLSRLDALVRTLDYPGLQTQLSQSLQRLRELSEQAARPCVQSSTARLASVAKRAARELGAFSPRQVSVATLPARATWPEWTLALGARHGPLTLALEPDGSAGLVGVPYVVPGGRFDEMYGWDSYFILLGLIADGRLDLARGLVDNFVYVIEHYGAILNANRTYYLTRSQPPFLTSMLRALWEATPPGERDFAWLARGTRAALREYGSVWTGHERAVASLCRGKADARVCLSHYAGRGVGQPPEVEPGHFDWLWEQLGRSLENSYAAGTLRERNLTAEVDRAFRHDRCMRESGHDTTYRWFWQSAIDPNLVENRCRDMVTVDLNSLLYKYEVDLAFLLRELLTARATPKGGAPEPARPAIELPAATPEPSVWCARAENRLSLMKRHMWSQRDGLFYDAFVSERGNTVQTGYVSATTLYPLWATQTPCEVDASARPPAIEPERAAALVTNALRQLEAPSGLLSTALESRERFSKQSDRQWDHPNGWAPHQMLAWAGLEAHGFHEDAARLTFAWLYTLLVNVIDYNGTIPEKYDVVRRTHAVFAEYGNVGTEFDYIATEGFGWMNASFQIGLRRLTPAERDRLGAAVARR